MTDSGPGLRERIRAFASAEIAPDAERVRAFLRTEVALLLASSVVITFKPDDAYWTVVYLLLVLLPTVASSARNAVDRLNTSVVGCTVAVLLIAGASDEPWLYASLQAVVVGITLFVARATPVGPPAMTGGASFAVITGLDVLRPPAMLIPLVFYRALQAVIGGGIGAAAQLALWPDDPLARLRDSLRANIAGVEARIRGEPVHLDPARVGRHFELLTNAEVRHRGLVGRRAEIAALVLDVARLVDQTVRDERLGQAHASAERRLADARAARQRLESRELFEPPPPAPPAPRLPWRLAFRDTMQPARQAALKTALAAFVAALITHVLGFTSAGALFAALTVSLQVTSGTAISKSLLVVAGVGVALAMVMLVIVPLMPNLEDPGSFLLVAAVAFAPTVWLTVGGPRVRNAGYFGTLVVASQLFEDFRPSIDLQASAEFASTISIGALVMGAIDLLIWPVHPRFGMLHRAALMMRETAELLRESDPRVVLAPEKRWRWRAHRHLLALVSLRGEHLPMPGTPQFAPEEEALQLAASAQRLIVARIEQARRELASGASIPGADAERAATAGGVDRQATEIEQRCRLESSR